MRRNFDITDGKLVALHDGAHAPIQLFIQPDADERCYLTQTLNIDEHTLTSALDPDELARMEFEPDHAALIFKRPRSYTAADHFVFKVASTGAFLFKDRLVIVISEDVPVFDGIPMTRVHSLPYLLLRLLYRSVFHFLEHLKIINTISEDLHGKINRSMENRHLINLFSLETSMVYYLNSISSNGHLLEKVRTHAAKLGLTTDSQEFLDDLIVENSQCYRQAEIYSNILAGLMDARASIVNNNLNLLMKTLNIIVILIMVPNLVVSLFSMNVVRLPLAGNPYGFWIIFGMAIVSALGFAALLRYKRW